MRHKLSTLILSGVLALSLTGGALASSGFTDIATLPQWGQEAVDYVTEQSLMNGTGNGQFSPNAYADRAMVATLIWRMAGSPIGNITGTFTDVPLNRWYSDAIDWAAEAEVVTGAEGRFRPFQIVTRQDLVVMLYRYAGSPASDVTVLSWYQDYNQVSSYAANAVAWAVSQGILTGDGAHLMPLNGTTRVQLAAILMRYLEADEEPQSNAVTEPREPGQTDAIPEESEADQTDDTQTETTPTVEPIPGVRPVS